MRKKLLSLLTVLCLVLGMLPATAMAAEIEEIAAELGYSEEEIAAATYIDEDAELDEDVEGLIIVVAPVKVTVKGAKLATGILVAPDAKGAVVTLGENADVNAVIVMATAEVVIEETAVAASVTVTAPETTVTVAGEVAVVTVAEEAESTSVTVAETAKVETVEVAAPAAAVEVAGEVASVAVAETAAAASVTVAENATVSTLEVAAPDVTAEVNGTVETVAVAETATGAELVVGENAAVSEVTDATGELTVSGDGAGNVAVTDTSASEEEEDKEDEETEDEEKDDSAENFTPDFVMPEPAPRPNDAKLVVAPQVDQSEENPKTNLSKDYDVSSAATGNNTYDVVIYAKDVVKHTNAQNNEGYWVGFGIPIKTGEGAPTYKYYAVETGNGITNETNWGSEISSIASRTYTVGDTTYNTVYFDVSDLSPMSLKMTETTSGTDNAQSVVEYIFNVTFDVTVVPEVEAEIQVSTLEDEILIEEEETEEVEVKEAAAEEVETEKPEIEEIKADEPDSEVPAEIVPETVVDEAA